MSCTSSASTSSRSSPESEASSVVSEISTRSTRLPDRTANPSGRAKSTFLFIDCQADTTRNSTVGKQKQAFLQKKYHQKQKQASIDRLKTVKGSSTPHPRLADTPADDTTEIRSFNSALGTEGEPEHEDYHAVSKRVAKMSEMWSLKAYLSQGYADPFSSTAVKMTDSMNQYFHHFRIHTIASCYPLDSTRMSIWWWQRAITQPALLQALLFLTAGHHATLESNNGVSSQAIQRSMKDSLSLRGNTLQTLNHILQDPVKAVAESTTLVVASLVAIEAVDANQEALEAHMKGLKRLIHLMGGLDKLDHMTLSKIYQSDVKSAALKNTHPTFPMSARFRSEILQESKVFRPNDTLPIPKDLSSLGRHFYNAPWYPQLDTSMKTLLQVLRRLILYFEVAQREPSIIMPTDNDIFLVFEHQLLSLSYAAQLDDLQEPLRLSLLIYINLRIWHLRTFPFMENMVEALRESLVPRLSYFQKTAPDLSFWVLFLGGMASQGYKCHPWFVIRLTEITRRLGLEDWATARSVLAGFFYTEQPAEKEADNLWHEVLLSETYPYIAPRPMWQVVRV
ncbi:hypothetical protein BDV28DRAFT_151295 [Aspergillus coremiiformis]|uniref:Fungal-specific transcription factor domain-containing protein n=1 Tax=Aspergillus coremiiformis TaxID=138285 RepID=A0A5N6Z046_9EURO|nr:hypothetical protein BDV28DRAFT_151295 [Aspergillus coremiiformis]